MWTSATGNARVALSEAPRLRDFLASDAEACMEVFDSNVGDFLHADEREDFAGWLAATQGRYLSLEWGGRVIGCCGYAQELEGRAGRPASELRMIWGLLHRDFHGRGLGEFMLLERLVRGARELPVNSASLGTTPRVAPFFERFSFRRIQYIHDGWGAGLHRVDMLLDLHEERIVSLEESLRTRLAKLSALPSPG